MGTIIRPRFGGIPNDGHRNNDRDEAAPVRLIGTVAGHRVIVLYGSNPSLGNVVQVVLVPLTDTGASMVSVHPVGQAGETDATAVATAVLKALAIVERAQPDAS